MAGISRPRYGTQIFNTDQGCQFTDEEFIDAPTSHGIQISMDGKGAWRDNVFVERFWRSIKYEEVYLRTYESAAEAKHFIGHDITFCVCDPTGYNQQRPHSSLDGRTPYTAIRLSRRISDEPCRL